MCDAQIVVNGIGFVRKLIIDLCLHFKTIAVVILNSWKMYMQQRNGSQWMLSKQWGNKKTLG